MLERDGVEGVLEEENILQKRGTAEGVKGYTRQDRGNGRRDSAVHAHAFYNSKTV